ncbi:hypothetical protein SAMN04487996_111150 [Dyadobacter soli]|uniref:DoxX-like family protein n=1 Tax=Dyadobacter soli TaxID=659014 RepID=A0A1G7M336_9BACT|nr:hypothetical protein [Dyadobacter soli]SDF56225.1 hypothetical protein SAMN04487996_111150 [Dyadobacter soli]
MLRYLLFALLLLHGAFHLAGFFAPVAGRVMAIDRAPGIYWAACSALFGLTALLLILHEKHWTWVALLAALTSQVLIASAWEQARFGTVPNIVIVLVVLALLFVKEAPVMFRD